MSDRRTTLAPGPARTDDGGAAPTGVTVRPYRPADHNACRRLWAEFAQHRDELYPERADARGEDVGAGFEEYLTRLDLSGMWVAHSSEDGVVGFLGLTLEGRGGAIDPVVVTRRLRGRGIGRALLRTVVDEARRRGLSQLTVSPAARDRSVLHSLHAAGFSRMASVTLSYPLRRGGQPNGDEERIDVYDLRFRS